MRRIKAIILVACIAVLSQGCLVVSIYPCYDDSTLGWDSNLIGTWIDADDKSSLQIQRAEWKSYRIHYVHPSETGDLTGYLTMIGNDRFLDVMPARGEDRGSFLIPVHAFLRLRLDDDQLELTPLSYDWFYDRLNAGKPIARLDVSFDQRQNALIVSGVSRLRDWLRAQPAESPVFGPPATFTRKAEKQ